MVKTRRAALAVLMATALAACTSSTTEPELGVVDGEVQDNVGNAVRGITFRLVRADRTPKVAVSGSDGQFSFPRVEPGTWQLEFTVPLDYTLATTQVNPVDVDVRGRRTTDVQVNLSRRPNQPPGGGGPITQGTRN